jgi:hypothetical protein
MHRSVLTRPMMGETLLSSVSRHGNLEGASGDAVLESREKITESETQRPGTSVSVTLRTSQGTLLLRYSELWARN